MDWIMVILWIVANQLRLLLIPINKIILKQLFVVKMYTVLFLIIFQIMIRFKRFLLNQKQIKPLKMTYLMMIAILTSPKNATNFCRRKQKMPKIKITTLKEKIQEEEKQKLNHFVVNVEKCFLIKKKQDIIGTTVKRSSRLESINKVCQWSVTSAVMDLESISTGEIWQLTMKEHTRKPSCLTSSNILTTTLTRFYIRRSWRSRSWRRKD